MTDLKLKKRNTAPKTPNKFPTAAKQTQTHNKTL